jgi:hypothetical protein
VGGAALLSADVASRAVLEMLSLAALVIAVIL